jgi:hypothetical protein
MSELTYTDCLELGPLGEVEVLVHYDYQPKEPMTREDPGCDEGADINGVTVTDDGPLKNIDIMEMLCESELQEMAIRILCENHGPDGYGWDGDL